MCRFYERSGENAYATLAMFALIVFFCFSIPNVSAQNNVQLPDLELQGQMTQTIGMYQLPASFSFEAEVRVDASNQWQHVVEVGGAEYTWHCPLRIEVGNQGQWYVAVGDGSSYVDADFQGGWTYGAWTKILFTYVNGVGKFYENGQLIKEFVANKNVSAVQGSLIVGSFRGTERFFQGGIRNGRIVAGEITPGVAPPPGQPAPPPPQPAGNPPVDDGLPIVRLSEGYQKSVQGIIWGGSHVKSLYFSQSQENTSTYAAINGQLINEGHFYGMHTRVAEWGNAVFQVQLRFFSPNNHHTYTQVNGVAIAIGDDVVVFKDNNGRFDIEANGQMLSGAIGQMETARFQLDVRGLGNNKFYARITFKDDPTTYITLNYNGPYHGKYYIDTRVHLRNSAFDGKNLGLFGLLPNNQRIADAWQKITASGGQDLGFLGIPVEKRLIK